MKPLRVGVIGAGAMGHAHALAWARIEEGPPRVLFRRCGREGRVEDVALAGEDPYEAECRHFLRVIRGEADPSLLAASEAQAGLRVIDAARVSLASGGPATP